MGIIPNSELALSAFSAFSIYKMRITQKITEATSVTATTEPPKQQRIGKQQRKSDYADFKATFLTPSKLVKRHPVNIEDSVWAKLERIARILGDRDTTVGSYINAILVEHLDLYGDDTEIWRKL